MKKKYIHYGLVSGDLEFVRKEIRKNLKDGWKLQGGIAMTHVGFGKIAYAQAIYVQVEENVIIQNNKK